MRIQRTGSRGVRLILRSPLAVERLLRGAADAALLFHKNHEAFPLATTRPTIQDTSGAPELQVISTGQRPDERQDVL